MVIIYHTYFESESENETEFTNDYSKILKSTSINIVQNYTYPTLPKGPEPGDGKRNITHVLGRLHNPTITEVSSNHYFIAFEVETNGQWNIWLSESTDGLIWSAPWNIQDNFTTARNPQLKFIQYHNKEEFRLYMEINGNQY